MMIDVTLLRALLSYNPDTGELIWRERGPELFKKASLAASWNRRHAGSKAFQTLYYGYMHGHIFKKHYFAHRVAWAIYHGEWPSAQIDHVNGNRSDNRIINLRDVSHSENQRNVKLRHDNKSGVPGVDWRKSQSLWRVRVNINGKRFMVGYFKDLNSAIAARQKAQIENNYHDNHGQIRLRHIP